jgi:CubicO group peptidase (beta-lactamase class C family)/peptidoglycan/LPS O-acetylase OafA/YrhL
VGPNPSAAPPPETAARSEGRETFLDVVRAVAIVRVIAWHAFGLAWITYVVAAMPAMFFVTGSLLAKSFGRRSARVVLLDRFRRLLVPLWVFGVVAWGVMAFAAWQMGTGLPLHRALAWVFPLADPMGTAWEGGWLSSHLWYLRTVVWLLLAAPLLLRALRARPAVALLVPIAAVFWLDVLARGADALPVSHRIAWGAGDLALYSVFLMAGFLHRDGAFRAVSRRAWVALAVLCALAAVAWRLTQPVPLGVVNNSHPLHLFVGAGWLALALATQRPLARIGASRFARRPIRAVGARALTIYLWHTAAIIVAVNVLEARNVEGPVAYPVALALLTGLGILIAVQLFGWVEDLAAGRRRIRAPGPAVRRSSLLGRRAIAGLALAGVAGAGFLSPHVEPGGVSDAAASGRTNRRPPIPSRPPPAPTFADAGTAADASPAVPLTAGTEQRLFDRLDGLMVAWAEATAVEGALVGVAGPTLRWSGAAGSRPETGAPVTVDDRIDLASLTKLFTAALVHRFADDGRIDLSAPVPPLASLPEFPYDLGITVEQLLSHTSGLVNYLDTDTYAVDPDAVYDPVSGVMASVAHALADEPGNAYLYSSTNYLVLGLLLEDLTGRPLSDLFRDVYFGPLGMRDTIHLAPAPSWPRGGTAGIETSLPDLLKAGQAILRDHVGLSDAAFATMTAIDVASGFGPGTFGFCPCRVDDAGAHTFFGIGYYGATTLLAHAPALNLTIAVDLVDSLGHNGGYEAVFVLFEMLEELAAS